MTLKARLIFSFLAFRDRIGHGASLTKLRETIQARNISPELAELEKAGLLKTDENKYYAIRPENLLDWFVPKKKATKAKHWSQLFMTHKHYLPSPECPLTLAQLATYCLVLDFDRQDKVVSPAGLATILAVNVRTIRRALDELIALGLFKQYPAKKGLDMVALKHTDLMIKWFVALPEIVPNKDLPVWEQRMIQTGSSKRRIERVRYLIERLANYYGTCKYDNDGNCWTEKEDGTVLVFIPRYLCPSFVPPISAVLDSDWELAKAKHDPRRSKSPNGYFQFLLESRLDKCEQAVKEYEDGFVALKCLPALNDQPLETFDLIEY